MHEIRFQRSNNLAVCVAQKQSDNLLNADDLDAMWVCLCENCVIDDATGAEKVCNTINCPIICLLHE